MRFGSSSPLSAKWTRSVEPLWSSTLSPRRVAVSSPVNSKFGGFDASCNKDQRQAGSRGGLTHIKASVWHHFNGSYRVYPQGSRLGHKWNSHPLSQSAVLR